MVNSASIKRYLSKMSIGDRKKCYSFTWTVENFSYCCNKAGVNIKSPTFVINEFKGAKYHLIVFPKVVLDENSIEIFLQRQRGGPNVKRDCELACLSNDGSVLKSKKWEDNNINASTLDFKERKDVFVVNTSVYLPEDKLTVRCRMWKSDGEFSEDVQCFARTRICIEKKIFLWKIQNFSNLQSEVRTTYHIKSVLNNELLMTFDLFTRNPYTDEDSITFQLVAENEKIKFLTLHLTTLNGVHTLNKSIQKEFLFCENKKSKLLTLPFSKKDLLANKNMCLPGDYLTLRCECRFSTGKISHEIESAIYGCESFPTNESVSNCMDERNTSAESKRILNENLKSLFHDSVLADMKMKTSNGTFLAHKSILSARSPVFKAMFYKDLENLGECIDIEDLDSATVSRMLQYVYTAEIRDLQWENACNLYLAADKYKILALRDECSAYLKANLCPENVCQVLILADKHQDEELKDSVQDFIFKHDVVNSVEWKKLMKTHVILAADTMFLQIQRKNLKSLGKIFSTTAHEFASNSTKIFSASAGFMDIIETKSLQQTSTVGKSCENILCTFSELQQTIPIKPSSFSLNSSSNQTTDKPFSLLRGPNFKIGSDINQPSVAPTLTIGSCSKKTPVRQTFTIGSISEQTPVIPTFTIGSSIKQTSVKPTFTTGSSNKHTPLRPAFTIGSNSEQIPVRPAFTIGSNSKPTPVGPAFTIRSYSDQTSVRPNFGIRSSSEQTLVRPTFTIGSSSEQTLVRPTFSFVSSNDKTPVKPIFSFGSNSEQTPVIPTFGIGSSSEQTLVRPALSFISSNDKTPVKTTFSFGANRPFPTTFSFSGSYEKTSLNPFFLNSCSCEKKNLRPSLSFDSSFAETLTLSSGLHNGNGQAPFAFPESERSSAVTLCESNSEELQSISPAIENSNLKITTSNIGFKSDGGKKMAYSPRFSSISTEISSTSPEIGISDEKAHPAFDSLSLEAPAFSEFENTSQKTILDSSVFGNNIDGTLSKTTEFTKNSTETPATLHFGTAGVQIPSTSVEFDNSSTETSVSVGFDTFTKTASNVSKFGSINEETHKSPELDTSTIGITVCSEFESANAEVQFTHSGFDGQ